MGVKYFVITTAVLATVLAGCGSSDKGKESESDGGDEQGSTQAVEQVSGTTAGKGGVALGGVFHLAQDEVIGSLFTPSIETLIASQVASQLHEGLLKFNAETLELDEAIAESYTTSEDETEYTFVIRQGVKFHDDKCFPDGKGREVTAEDFKYTFELLCSGEIESVKSNYESLFKDVLLGAEAYHKGQTEGIEGIVVEDARTLKIKLIQPQSSFIYRMAMNQTAVVAKEAFEMYGEELVVGAGPFVYDKLVGESHLLLAKNPNYYRQDEHGNQLPYLDSVKFHFVDNKAEQLEMFEAGKLSMLYGLPAEKVTEIVSEKIDEYQGVPPAKILILKPELVSQYYEFNMTREHFKDVRVRQAFNYAINRQKIIENVLKSQSNKYGDYGITPPVKKLMKGYPFDSLRNYGYSYDAEKAKQLMAEAGYENGENFPILKLEINSGGRTHNKIAKEVTKQLESVLGIHVNQEVVPFEQKLEDAKYGRADLFRSAWVADYPDPETFLANCYGKNVPATLNEPSHPNTMRYVSAEFDRFFEAGRQSSDLDERYGNFYEAEKIMLQDAPIIMLWYAENYKLYYSYIRGFQTNEMQHLDLSTVYLKSWSEGEWKEQHH